MTTAPIAVSPDITTTAIMSEPQRRRRWRLAMSVNATSSCTGLTARLSLRRRSGPHASLWLPARGPQKCEPAVFRARRAHTRTLRPRVDAAGRALTAFARAEAGTDFERRAVEQSGFPLPPGNREPPGTTTGPLPDGSRNWDRRDPAYPLLTGPMRSWPPGRRDRVGAESQRTLVLRQGGTEVLRA